MKLRSIICMFVVVLVVALTHITPAQEAPLSDFDDYVIKALKDWDVPGLAIAIVKNDRLVLARGYGVRKLGEPAAVDERTIFAIGSASKAFTSAAVAMLVDEGKIKWNDPVTKHLPGFQLFDPHTTRELTVRDLLCHRVGLDRADMIWYGTPFDRDEIVRRIRFVKPANSLRSAFGYQNIMYLTAGQTVSAVSGKSWDEFIRDRIFVPLEMSSSSTSIKALSQGNNVATPHMKVDEKLQPVPYRNIDNIAPAGSINSNVAEMAHWVRLQLGEGSYNGKRVIESSSIREMQEPQTIIRREPPWTLTVPDAKFLSYGLGWFLHDHRGRKVVQHGGNIDGMAALVAMIPEEKLGMVVLTNMNGTRLPSALMFRIFDAYLGAPARDWSADLLKTSKTLEAQAKASEKRTEEARVNGTSPSLPLDKYAGSYNDDAFGDATISVENGKLTLRTPAFAGELDHWHYDTFRVNWKSGTFGHALVTFTLDAQGKVDSLRIAELSMGFKRIAEKAKPARM